MLLVVVDSGKSDDRGIRDRSGRSGESLSDSESDRSSNWLARWVNERSPRWEYALFRGDDGCRTVVRNRFVIWGLTTGPLPETISSMAGLVERSGGPPPVEPVLRTGDEVGLCEARPVVRRRRDAGGGRGVSTVMGVCGASFQL